MHVERHYLGRPKGSKNKPKAGSAAAAAQAEAEADGIDPLGALCDELDEEEGEASAPKSRAARDGLHLTLRRQ